MNLRLECRKKKGFYKESNFVKYQSRESTTNEISTTKNSRVSKSHLNFIINWISNKIVLFLNSKKNNFEAKIPISKKLANYFKSKNRLKCKWTNQTQFINEYDLINRIFFSKNNYSQILEGSFQLKLSKEKKTLFYNSIKLTNKQSTNEIFNLFVAASKKDSSI
jgi:hypothetical protein